MISFQTYQKIQDHKGYGASMLRTSQFMGLSYNTVYKWWYLTEDDFNAFQCRHEFVLDNYRQYFIEQLKITPQMNNTLLYKRLIEDFGDEIEVPMSTFHRYIKNLREQTGYVKPQRKTGLREDPAPGYEAQVDYGQYVMKSMYGNNVRVYFFCMILSYSRMKFVYFSVEPFDAEKTIEAHMHAFKYFGGRPQMIVYDQDRCLCIDENFGEIVFVKEFEVFVRETEFSIYLCRNHDPQTKGRVENAVGIVKKDFLDGRIYHGIDELNMSCLAWLDGFGNGQVNERTKKIPRDMFANEYMKLQHVYERKNDGVKVLTPDKNIIEFKRKLKEKQRELLSLASTEPKYDHVADEIYKLRDKKQQIHLNDANKETSKRRVADLINFIQEHDDGIAEYDDALVRKLIQRITVYDDHFTVLFKSVIDIDIEA